MKHFKNKKYLVIAIAVIFIAAIFIFRARKPSERDFVLVKRADLVQEVSVTGKVEPASRLELAFEKTGKIAGAYFDAGDKISAGTVLVEQDSSELRAQLAKAEADLEAQKSTFRQDETILENYYKSVEDVINDAYTKANDAVRKQIDDLFIDDEKNPQLTFTTKSLQLESDAEFARLRTIKILDEWLSSLKLIGSYSVEQLETAIVDSRSRLSLIRTLLDLVARATIDSTGLSQATISTYQGNINTARANINTALSNVNSKDQNIQSQKLAVASQKASVDSYAANAENIRSQVAKTVLRSPISGIVAKQEAKVGEIVGANQVVVSVISGGNLEITANIPEADISKLKMGDKAKVTLDAYGDETPFEAVIAAIEPAETVVEGVATYKTTFKFLGESELPKSGMTANIDVITAGRTNILLIPQRAIFSRDGEKFVFIDTGRAKPEERNVEAGLRGSDGNTEILSGLKEGEKVLLSL